MSNKLRGNMHLVEQAKLAIRRVFENTAVPPEVTKDSLVELRDEIDVLVDAMRNVRKRG